MDSKAKESPEITVEHLAHSRMTSLINSMADGVIAVDDNMKLVLFNGAALNILDRNNLKQGDKLGKVLEPIDKDYHPVDIEKLVGSTKIPTSSRDMLLTYSDGSKSNLYLSIAPVRLGYGESKDQEGYILLMRDITAEKSLEEERDEFISVVSHELRTPVAIAEGNVSNAQLILDKGGELSSIKKALNDAHSQILYLADLINDLSTLSRAERGKLTLDIEPINVHDLIKELVDNYSAQADSRGLQLKTDIDSNLERLWSSKLYVREILQNFITNALKYTQKGHVSIEAKQKEGGVQISVSDTGIGINKADQEHVFEKFFRSEDFRTRQSNGTGLGLYVTMKLAHLTGAKITYHSELNKGTTFNVFFPNINELGKAKDPPR